MTAVIQLNRPRRPTIVADHLGAQLPLAQESSQLSCLPEEPDEDEDVSILKESRIVVPSPHKNKTAVKHRNPCTRTKIASSKGRTMSTSARKTTSEKVSKHQQM